MPLITPWEKRQNMFSKRSHLLRATKRSTPRSLRNLRSTSCRRKILFTSEHVFIAECTEKEKPWKPPFEICTSWLNIVTSVHKEMSKLGTELLYTSQSKPRRPHPPPPHPGICEALLGLYYHNGSSLSPQYVGDSRVFLLLS